MKKSKIQKSEGLEKNKIVVTGDMIDQVATISTNNDPELGKLVGDAFRSVGNTGIVMMETSADPECSLQVVEGVQCNMGLTNSHFITNQKNKTAELDNPLVLLVESPVESIRQIQSVLEYVIKNNKSLLIEPLKRIKNRLVLENKTLGNFDACAILLNNDLSAGIPDVLKNIEQNLIPPLHAGWSSRRKSQHFKAYDEVVKSFAEFIKVDPWLINPYFDHASGIDFHARQGEDELAIKVEQILNKIQSKYKEYKIEHEPFVIVKADAGTYGMGIMTVKHGDELRNLNRKSRNKMSVVKEGLEVSEVIIQEGVYSEECINEAVAEPVVYMIDHFVIGGFYRVHTTRGKDENLNAPGMHFVPLAFETSCSTPEIDESPLSTPNRFYAYGVIARLALLAASIELETHDPINQ